MQGEMPDAFRIFLSEGNGGGDPISSTHHGFAA